jgi:hypothetical protein
MDSRSDGGARSTPVVLAAEGFLGDRPLGRERDFQNRQDEFADRARLIADILD